MKRKGLFGLTVIEAPVNDHLILWFWACVKKYVRSQTTDLTVKEQKGRGRGRVPVAHACNPSYSGGRDQEDRGSKSA
jgi:hypothetical protein